MSKNSSSKYISNGSLYALMAIIAAILVFAIILSVFIVAAKPFSTEKEADKKPASTADTYPFYQEFNFSVPEFSNDSQEINASSITSGYAAVLNVTDNEFIAYRQSTSVIFPASMTKVMTLIVVYENLKSEASLNEVLTISQETYDRMVADGSSGFGLKAGEKLTVKDLLYVMILQSDNIACVTLAEYIAGSESSFVKMMNEKAREMGLEESKTLFQNCTGLHHRYHYSTCHDIAVIMNYAMKNTFCAEILTAKKHIPSKNFRPNDGITFWNAFLVQGINDGKTQPDNATFIAGKTGYTPEAKQCLVSYVRGDDGKDYIVVTAAAPSSTARLQDQLDLYNKYVTK